jgi:hypothetical protein
MVAVRIIARYLMLPAKVYFGRSDRCGAERMYVHSSFSSAAAADSYRRRRGCRLLAVALP